MESCRCASDASQRRHRHSDHQRALTNFWISQIIPLRKIARCLRQYPRPLPRPLPVVHASWDPSGVDPNAAQNSGASDAVVDAACGAILASLAFASISR